MQIIIYTVKYGVMITSLQHLHEKYFGSFVFENIIHYTNFRNGTMSMCVD